MSFSFEEKSFPFTLPCELGEITCLELMRSLPGKRSVFKGQMNNDNVIVKCFFGSKGRRDYKREHAGLRGFIKAGISTPDLLYHGRVKQGRAVIYIVVTRFVDASIPFDQLWKTSLSDYQRLVWLYRVVRLLCRLYGAGVTPVDIHLDNLLVREQTVFLIDGGGVSVQYRQLSRTKALDNFTLFMSVLAPRYEHFTHKLYLALASFAPKYAGVSLSYLMAKIHEWRKWRERYVEKTLRTCSEFIAEKCFSRFQVINRSQDSEALRTLLRSPDDYIAQGVEIKQGRTNTVTLVTLDDGEQVFVKRYRSTKRFGWLRMLTMSRARRSWLGAYLLKMLDIKTPIPLAILERKIGPLVRSSYLVSEYIPGVQLLHYFDPEAWPKDWDSVVAQVKDCLLSLERSFISHGDLKATNFIAYQGAAYLIDLDSMISCKTFKQYQPLWKKDCDRFMRNWEHNPDVAVLFQSNT